ncbi:C69 family dipeptidase, partial [Salmonella enterica subsp. enterica serovar Cerro]|nr:C69 family dipeptidase [Salmonella enterica subsp. enterica serovar Cerro]
YASHNPQEPWRPISVFRTQESHILQVRPKLPQAIGNVEYIAYDGDNHLPGNSAWGGRVTLTLTKLFTPNIKGDMGFVYQGPFER